MTKLQVNEVVVYDKRNGGPRLYNNANYMTVEEFYHDTKKGRDYEFIRNPEYSRVFLLSGIRLAEKNFDDILKRETKGDTALLNRIIRGGGFINYAKNLESAIC